MTNVKVVPLVATKEQVMAGEKAHRDQLNIRIAARFSNPDFKAYPSEETEILASRAAYDAMLAAAPASDYVAVKREDLKQAIEQAEIALWPMGTPWLNRLTNALKEAE